MKEILLTQGKIALVDDEDFEKIIAYKWHCDCRKNTIYAETDIITDGTRKYKSLRMHRLITNPSDNLEIDHINGNGLDNRKENLRPVTRRQNLQNYHIKKSSRFTGVSWHKHNKKWQCRIEINGHVKSLGYFMIESLAAEAYNKECDLLNYEKLSNSIEVDDGCNI